MQTAFFTYQQAKLCYHKIGKGTKILLFFHGYGQQGRVFEENSRFLQEEYTCYLFDLFFHGQSEWNYGEAVLSKAFWQEMIRAFLEEQKIERFSLAGFSMGGRFVFATLETQANCIEAIYLMAPDGVKTNFWYNLATYPSIFRRLFRSMILKPSYFYSIANVIYKIGLVDKGLIRFAESQMKTEDMRSRVYHSWVVFRPLYFDMKTMASLIKLYNISTSMVLGKFDKVITVKNMQHLLKHLPDCKVELLDTGHNGIISQWKP